MGSASKKAKGPSEEDTLRGMLAKATGSYRGNPAGIAALTEKAMKAIGVQPQPDRRDRCWMSRRKS
jgi:hypothetical protein